MIQKTTQKHYNQPKQQDKNLEIGSEDIKTGPNLHITRDQDMTRPTEEVNREKEQDQGVILDLKNIRVQEKLEQMLIGIIMDLKLQTNQEVEAKEHIDEEGIFIKEMAKNPINQNRTYQYEEKNRGEGWDDNPNDDWTKCTQMQKDPPDNHSDRDSTQTEDEAPQHHITPPQPKYPAQQTQRAQQIQVQLKQQAPAQIPKKQGRIDQPPNQDDIDEQEIIKERLAALQKEKEEMGISDSDVEWQQLIGVIDKNNNLTPRMINTGMNKDKPVVQSQLSVIPTQKSQHRSGVRQRLKKAERELEELKAKQQLQQQNNIDINNTNVEIPVIQVYQDSQLVCNRVRLPRAQAQMQG
ncbi:MAG: hypothetical protein EZS28_044104 [Streblomastix strix]|uniref:Uncharacterized protein n=1 Tax=Streblomastix strix TaxID=222440 RepID=A0A5J4TR32_9EUKA|nr:MAG: hypothetical protein EZS28_044104 [Streblomastix strix]